jgi:CRP-like cAMP-binding protein
MVSPSLDEALELLARRGWFSERSQAFRTAVAGAVRLREFETGEPLYLYGDIANGIFGIVTGSVDISIPRSDGLELTVHRGNPGFWVGDLALLSSETRLVSLHAAEPTVTVHVSAEQIRRLVRETPSYYEDFYALSHENMATALRLLADMTTSPSEARVGLRLLLDSETQPERGSWFHITQATLAPMVALSVPSLRRILHKMEAAGLVETDYARIRIRDHNRLLRLCHDTTQLSGPAGGGALPAGQPLAAVDETPCHPMALPPDQELREG